MEDQISNRGHRGSLKMFFGCKKTGGGIIFWAKTQRNNNRVCCDLNITTYALSLSLSQTHTHTHTLYELRNLRYVNTHMSDLENSNFGDLQPKMRFSFQRPLTKFSIFMVRPFKMSEYRIVHEKMTTLKYIYLTIKVYVWNKRVQILFANVKQR